MEAVYQIPVATRTETANKQSDFMKFAGHVAPYAPTISSTGTTVASIVALIFAIKANCAETDPIAPFIATLAVATATNFITIFKDIYDYREKKESEKKALKKELERNNLEATRHEELSNLLLKTLETVRRYEETQKQRDFMDCVEAIKQMPQTSKDQSIRDVWFSRLIALSNNEEGLQETFKEIKKIGVDIQKDGQELAQEANKATQDPHNNKTDGEGNKAAATGLKDISLGNNLLDYQKKWKDLEEKAGFPLQFIEIKGIRYGKNGAAIFKKEKEDSTIEL